jgi:SRSO17 transposase
VFLAYASVRGRALIDRRLYVPEHSWLAASVRCRGAGVPAGVAFATKPALATQMITAALDAGIGAAWVLGDEVYGQDPLLRAVLEERLMPYVLAIAGNRTINLEGIDRPAAEIAAGVTDHRHWHRYSAGDGAKGPRYYAWAWARTTPTAPATGGC